MADYKTQLRELCFILTLELFNKNISFTVEDLYDAKKFLHFGMMVSEKNISKIEETLDQIVFAKDIKEIIDDSYGLAEEIFTHPYFKFDSKDQVEWVGGMRKDDPVDVIFGQYGFSLKDKSFILGNIGLARMINYLTGSEYKNRHIFKDYAFEKYSAWFDVTWKKMVEHLLANNNIWETPKSNKDKKSTITLENNEIIFTFCIKNKEIASAKFPKDCSTLLYEEKTNAKIREEVFAKFIKLELNNDIEYSEVKRQCAIAACEALIKEIKQNLNYKKTLPNFLRIHSESYYYAKITSSDIEVYKVPSLYSFTDDITIESIKVSVPKNQANIVIKIKNNKAGGTLTLRNECRYSHGQFNGTPESKLYYEGDKGLLNVYESIA